MRVGGGGGEGRGGVAFEQRCWVTFNAGASD